VFFETQNSLYENKYRGIVDIVEINARNEKGGAFLKRTAYEIDQ
jgi:hypothetical protein